MHEPENVPILISPSAVFNMNLSRHSFDVQTGTYPEFAAAALFKKAILKNWVLTPFYNSG
jgi:hypothetical protein